MEMTLGKVVIIMGSRSDLEYAESMGRMLEEFNIDYEYRIASAHRTPDRVLSILKEYETSGERIVYITVVGLSDALSGVVAGYTERYPVIACPPDSERLGGSKVLSALDTPRGVAAPLVMRPENAVLHAAKILGLHDLALSERITQYYRRMREKVERDDSEIRARRRGVL